MGQEHSQPSNATETDPQRASTSVASSALPTQPPTVAPMQRADSIASMASDSSFEIMSINGDAASPQAQQQQRPASRSWAALAASASASASPSRPDSRCSNASSFELIDRSATPSLVTAGVVAAPVATPHSALSSPLHMHALADSRAVSFAESIDSFAMDGCSMPTTPMSRSSRASPRSASPVSMLCALSQLDATAVPALAAREPEPSQDDFDDSLPSINEDNEYCWSCPNTDDDLDDGLREDHRTAWLPNGQLRQRQQSAFGTRATYKSQLSRKQLKEEARVKLACFRAVRRQVRNEHTAASAAAPKQHASVTSLSARTRVSPAAVASITDNDEDFAESKKPAAVPLTRAEQRLRQQTAQQQKMHKRHALEASRASKRSAAQQKHDHLPLDPLAKQTPPDLKSTSRRARNPLLLKDPSAAPLSARQTNATWLLRRASAAAVQESMLEHARAAFSDASIGVRVVEITPVVPGGASLSSLVGCDYWLNASMQIAMALVEKHPCTTLQLQASVCDRHFKLMPLHKAGSAAVQMLRNQGHKDPVRSATVCGRLTFQSASRPNPRILDRQIKRERSVWFQGHRQGRNNWKRWSTLQHLQVGVKLPLFEVSYTADSHPLLPIPHAKAISKFQTRALKRLAPPARSVVQRTRDSAAQSLVREREEERAEKSIGHLFSPFIHGRVYAAEARNEAWIAMHDQQCALWAAEARREWEQHREMEREKERQRLLEEAEEVYCCTCATCGGGANEFYTSPELERIDEALLKADEALQIRPRHRAVLGGRVTIKSQITRKFKKQEAALESERLNKTKAEARTIVEEKNRAAAAASSAAASVAAVSSLVVSRAADRRAHMSAARAPLPEQSTASWRVLLAQRRERLQQRKVQQAADMLAEGARLEAAAASSRTSIAPPAEAAELSDSDDAEAAEQRGCTSEGLRTTAPNKRAQREAKRAILSVVRAGAEEDREPAVTVSKLGLLSAQRRLNRKTAARSVALSIATDRAILDDDDRILAASDSPFTPDFTCIFHSYPCHCADDPACAYDSGSEADSTACGAWQDECGAMRHADGSFVEDQEQEEESKSVEPSPPALPVAAAAAAATTDEDDYDDDEEFFFDYDRADSLAAVAGFDAPAVAIGHRRRVSSLALTTRSEYKETWQKSVTKVSHTARHSAKPKSQRSMGKLNGRSQRSTARAAQD